MPNKIRGLLDRRPLWIIASYQQNRMNVLTVDPHGDDGGFLPVFSFEEEAETFLRLSEADVEKTGLRSRETTAGELISVLLAPCAEVWGVALDPLPLTVGVKELLPLVSVNRDRFIQAMMGESRREAGELELV